MANKPATWELYTLAEGTQKITVKQDTKIPNAATFIIEKEDHTLACILRNSILKNPKVIFCGYKVPHPLESKFLLKIRTNGEILPETLLLNEIKKLVGTITNLSKSFSLEVERMRT
jgi:DNA-directed RNA polymerase II subunit RPB11